jgi:hypothetical protein
MFNNDEESSTESSGSSETANVTVPKSKPVNELSSSDEGTLNKRQRTGLSFKKAMALFKQSHHLNDCVLMNRMESSCLPFPKAA